MRKEAIFAIVFGVLIGLVIAFGIFRINSAMKDSTPTGRVSTDASKDTLQKVSDGNLSLLKPFDRQVFGDSMVSISGVAKAESYIIVTGGSIDQISRSLSDGTFEFDYEIDPSINYLTVNSLSITGERSKTNLELIYSSEAALGGDEEEISEKVENKLEEAQRKAEFFKGTVTDITDKSIQIKNGGGEIKQISLSGGETTYARIGKTTVKLTSSDVAIGDYIYALGYKGASGVLDAFRVLVTQPETPADIKVFLGLVTTKNKTDLSLSENSQGDTVLEIDNNTKTYSGELAEPTRSRFANISEGDLIIGTYVTEENENIARKIHILKSSGE